MKAVNALYVSRGSSQRGTIRIGVLSKCINQYEFMSLALCEMPNTWIISASSVVANKCYNTHQTTLFRMRITFEPRFTTDRETCEPQT